LIHALFSTIQSTELDQNRSAVKHHVLGCKTVKPLHDYLIYIEVAGERNGIFDLKPYLDHGIFCEFRDVHYFNQVGILFGSVTWPNEQDIAPETLLDEMALSAATKYQSPLQYASKNVIQYESQNSSQR